MKKINLKYIIFCFCLLSACCMSCSFEEPAGGGEKGEEQDMASLVVPITKAGETEDEERIANARLMVFNSTGNILVNTFQSGNDIIPFSELVPVGKLNVILIANELTEWNLNDVKYLKELNEKMLSFTDHPEVSAAKPIPMMGDYQNVWIDEDSHVTDYSGNTVTISLVERLYAKVTLNLSCVFAIMDGSHDPIKVGSVSMRCMPKSSRLMPTKYWGADFFNGTTAPMNNYTSDDKGFSGVWEFYIPEYLINDTSKYTYINITTALVNEPKVERTYRLVIGDGIDKRDINYMLHSDQRTPEDLTVTRNTHYMLDAKILSFFADESITLTAYVKTWKEININSNYTDYLFTILQNEFSISDAELPYAGWIYVKTDDPAGWSAVISNASGNISFTDYTAGEQVKDSGMLKFQVTGTLTGDETIDVTSGNVTKKISFKKG